MKRYATLVALMLFACDVDESGIPDPEEAVTYDQVYPDRTLVTFAGETETLTFESESEFLAWAASSPQASDILDRWEAIQEERAIVFASGLYAIDDDSDPRIAAYGQELRARRPSRRVGPGALWDGTNCGNPLLNITDFPAPSISSSKRDRASSWCPIGPGSLTVFDNTWYRGDSAFRVGLVSTWNFFESGFDNRIGSFF